MAIKTAPKKAPAVKAAPAKPETKKVEKAEKEKVSYPVDSNYLLKRFQKDLAKGVFSGDEDYGDYLALKKALHTNCSKFAEIIGFKVTLGEGEKAKEVELTAEIVLEAAGNFLDGFDKAAE